jgi:hypothetical protein
VAGAAVAGAVVEVAGAVAEVAGVAADVAWVAGDAAWAAGVAGACAAGAAAGLPADGAASVTGALSTRNSAGVTPERTERREPRLNMDESYPFVFGEDATIWELSFNLCGEHA